MIYIIKQVACHPFNNDILILQENGDRVYSLKATGFILCRLLIPNFSVQDKSGTEIIVAQRAKVLKRNKHFFIQNESIFGFVEEVSIHSYIINVQDSREYQIKLSGFSRKKWELFDSTDTIAQVFPDFKKWGWRVDLLSEKNSVYILSGLALIYSYFQDTGP